MMMEFNVNHADPGFPARHGPHALEGGPQTTQPLLQQKASAAAHPGDPQPSTLSRRTNCNPDPAREPGNLEAVRHQWRREERIGSNIQSLSGKLEGLAVVFFFCCCGGLFY